jgi:hypothetical protein
MCFNKYSTNLSLICYFTIKLANGTNEYFLTIYYIWQKHTEEQNKDKNKHEEKEHGHKHEDKNKDEENKNEVAPQQPNQPKPKYQVFC